MLKLKKNVKNKVHIYQHKGDRNGVGSCNLKKNLKKYLINDPDEGLNINDTVYSVKFQNKSTVIKLLDKCKNIEIIAKTNKGNLFDFVDHKIITRKSS